MRIAVTGASGMIGKHLIGQLRLRGETVWGLRRAGQKGDGETGGTWNVETGEIQTPDQMDVLIHLAGRNVASRWTDKVKREIWDSRIPATEKLCAALAKRPETERPKLLISTSAVGIYGDRGEEVLTEESSLAPAGVSFLADVCRGWEAATQAAEQAGIRLIHPRISVVLSKQGGALAALLTPTKFGLGGPVGSGRQWMPWISLNDMSRLLTHLAETREFHGVVNAVAGTVRQHEFMRTLGGVLHRPTIFPLPKFAVKMAFGRMGEEVLLGSQRVKMDREAEAFTFEDADLEATMRKELREP